MSDLSLIFKVLYEEHSNFATLVSLCWCVREDFNGIPWALVHLVNIRSPQLRQKEAGSGAGKHDKEEKIPVSNRHKLNSVYSGHCPIYLDAEGLQAPPEPLKPIQFETMSISHSGNKQIDQTYIGYEQWRHCSISEYT
ncbi:hypothetical protein Nepgr_009969 [Nepenthes gracilis]|uniref:Uncharacterized protein n=1 Tax=Nepenthes gracilis TaxID=150966 RepID=A0AAD3XKV3_NEPGR|nr:hypothetical protein Nepgr_009969 [Nepenthes gracilis]